MVTDPVRRKILSVLADEETMTRTDLAEILADDEDIPTADIDSLPISLHHNHLPSLDDSNHIEYDARNGDIVLWEDPERVRAQLHDE